MVRRIEWRLLFLPLVAAALWGCVQPQASLPNSQDPRELNQSGVELLRQGDTDKAIKAFRMALSRDPQYPEARYNLGVALFKMGQSEAAIRELELATRLRPDFSEALIVLAKAYRLQGEPEKATLVLGRLDQLGKEEAHTYPYAVQVAAEEDLLTAVALARELSARYKPEPKISRVEADGRTLYRVRIEAESRSAAEKLARQLRGENKAAWIVKVP